MSRSGVSQDRPADVDTDLIDRARSGDESAWGELYDQMHRPLLGYLRGKGAQDPEDLLGEVFLRLARNIPSFSGGVRDLRAYAFTIAKNCLRDAGRRRSVRPDTVFLPPTDLEIHLDASESLEHDALVTINLEHYQDGFAQLTPQQRQVLYLRVMADLSIKQTAEMVGTTEGAVKQLHRRGLDILRSALIESPPTEVDLATGEGS